MSALTLHYRGVGGRVARPTGAQPHLWIQPRAAGGPAALADRRTSPPAGLVVGGSLPAAAGYGPDARLAYLLDGHTAITASGLGLAGSHQLTLLLSAQFADHNGQYYFLTYGAGTNYDDHSFDLYSNNSQAIYRAREAPGSGTSAFIGYMNAPGTPSAFALVADYTSANPHSVIEPQYGAGQNLPGGAIPLTWADYTLTLTQGQGGAIPLPPSSQLRYFLLFAEALTLEKCQEWQHYLDSLP